MCPELGTAPLVVTLSATWTPCQMLQDLMRLQDVRRFLCVWFFFLHTELVRSSLCFQLFSGLLVTFGWEGKRISDCLRLQKDESYGLFRLKMAVEMILGLSADIANLKPQEHNSGSSYSAQKSRVQ